MSHKCLETGQQYVLQLQAFGSSKDDTEAKDVDLDRSHLTPAGGSDGFVCQQRNRSVGADTFPSSEQTQRNEPW